MRKRLLKIPAWKLLFFSMPLCLYCMIYAGNGKAMAGTRIPQAGNNAADTTGIEIRGMVTDTLGNPIPGVTIMLKGNPKVGTVVDPNGKYLLVIPNKVGVLTLKMMGYVPQEVPVAGRKQIDIVLKSDAAALGEVVVVAFGKQKKQDMIGAVTSVNVADLKTPSSNLTTALAGQIAGMIAYQRSGEPGADNADFFIRGVTTFGYKKDPLILIDGIEVSSKDLARLQPDDVASFSILKDATATSLYGARGANGVILITTKEGKEGKLSVSIRVENSLSAPTRNVELADPITYMKLGNEAVLTRNPLGIPPYAQSKIDNTIAGGNPAVYPTTDWQKALFKRYTMNQRVNLNGSGGGKVARYYLAGTFNQDNGVLRVDGRNNFNSNVNLKTYSLRSNININMTPTTEVIARLSGTFDDYKGPIDGGSAIYNQGMHSNPVLFPAYFEPDEANAHVKHILFGNYGTGTYLNPYANLVKGYKEYASSKMDAQFELKQDLSFWTKGLTARVLFNTSRYTFYDVSRYYTPFYYAIGSYDRKTDVYQLMPLNETTGKEYLDFDQGAKDVRSTTYLEASINYQTTINQVHDLSGTLVSIMRNSIIGNAGDLQSSLPFRNAGISGRATYSYRSRYYAEFNFGYNGSERFYKTERFGFFPSAGIAWNISNEDFWKPIHPVVSNLKFRATYGLVGNDAIGRDNDRFFYLSNVNMDDWNKGAYFGTNNGYGRSGVTVSRYSNTDITWEKSRKTNIGFEATLKDKLTIEADYFHENRTNILMDRASIPTTMGLSAPVRANVGEAVSKGVDGSIVYSDFFGKNFWIKARANFTFATSAFKVYEEPQYAEGYKLHVGHSLSQQWGYIAERMFLDDAEVLNSPRQNFGVYAGGDLKYRDVNGDGQITDLDKVPLGYPTDPEIIYGFGFSMGYKNFDLSVFFQGSARSSFWIDAKNTAPFINETQLLKAYADSYWSEDNRNSYALWPRLSSTENNNNIQQSSWFMRDGDFLRMKTLEIGYTLPKRTKSMVWLSNARVYLSGINLFSLSKFKLWDVEMGGYGLGYPVQRVVNAGLFITL
ncbi:SusC/RagA family TonB-linked outer membrane protein [Chitinophaga defluvii]|uniref:TonB-dependent receptor n=1 Tax=Chitinophaga defluvii TaxID=3163343 RepID=A0ABV2TAH6_9BACT